MDRYKRPEIQFENSKNKKYSTINETGKWRGARNFMLFNLFKLKIQQKLTFMYNKIESNGIFIIVCIVCGPE